jgi:hypothetical protein
MTEGRDALAFGVRDDLRLTVGVDMGYGREGCAKINADCFALVHFWRRRLGSFARTFWCNFRAASSEICRGHVRRERRQ